MTGCCFRTTIILLALLTMAALFSFVAGYDEIGVGLLILYLAIWLIGLIVLSWDA